MRPVKRNVTRWTDVPDMFQRFERLLPNLDEVDNEIMDLIPTAGQKRNIRDHKQTLADFKSVTIALQRHDMSMKESDVLFRSIVDSYPEFAFNHYLGNESTAKIWKLPLSRYKQTRRLLLQFMRNKLLNSCCYL